MINYIKKISDSILSIHRYSKRIIAIITDLGLCILCTWLAFVLRLEELVILKNFNFYPALISIMIAIPIFWLFGLYRTILRFTSLSIVFTIIASSFVYGLLYFSIIGIYEIQNVPRSIGILQPMLLFFGLIGSRLSVKFVLTNHYYNEDVSTNKKNVFIYGAGQAGRQLLISLENSVEFKVIGFLDDNITLSRQILMGKKIYSSLNLKNLIKKKDIKIIFLALPSISRSKRNTIIKKLNQFKLIVKTLPSISEIIDDRITVSDIKDFNIEDLLNRDQVQPDIELLKKNINKKNVLVTGAGGTIGSEICRQISKLKPKKLLLLELNEFALYKIYEELKDYNIDVKIIPLLL